MRVCYCKSVNEINIWEMNEKENDLNAKALKYYELINHPIWINDTKIIIRATNTTSSSWYYNKYPEN